MIIGKTLIKEGSQIVFHRGRIIAVNDPEELGDKQKMEDAEKKIDAEIEQEIRAVVLKVLEEKNLI